MKKFLGILMIAALGLMIGCTGKVEKVEKVTKNDSVVEKDVTVKFGCMQGGADSCNMDKCCSNKMCDSLCNELSKLICQIVDLKVKQTMCMQMCMNKGMKCDPAQCKQIKCDPTKCDPKKCDPKCKMQGKQ